MSKDWNSLSDDVYTFVEGENENEFFFYRNDGEPLGEYLGRIPMDFCQAYLARKMMEENVTTLIARKVYFEKSADDKMMKITFSPMEEDAVEEKRNEEEKKMNFFRRFLNRVIGYS